MNCFACLAHRSDIQRNAQGRHPVVSSLSASALPARKAPHSGEDSSAIRTPILPAISQIRFSCATACANASSSGHPNKRRRAPGRRWAPPTPVPAHIHFRSISRSAPRAVHPGQTAHNATNRIPDGRRKRAAQGFHLPAHFFNVSHPASNQSKPAGRKKQLHIFKTILFADEADII